MDVSVLSFSVSLVTLFQVLGILGNTIVCFQSSQVFLLLFFLLCKRCRTHGGYRAI